MEKLKILIATICCIFSFQTSWGQIYKYPTDNSNSSDNSTLNECVDYVKRNYIPSGERTDRYSARYYKFPNNRGIVVTHFDYSHKEKQELKSDNIYWAPWTGLQKAESITYKVSNSKTYAVFVNENGTLINVVPVSDRFDIILSENKILLLTCYTTIDKDNNNARSYAFREIKACNHDGSISWNSDNQMVFLDYALTSNNLYIVGEISNPEYKVISISDGVVQTDKRIAENGSRYTNVSFKANGVSVKRLFKDGHTTYESFNYEPNDKNYQEKLIIKQYNKNNALDQVTIGLKYLNGTDFTKDEKKAVEWFQKAANQNNDKGQYRLGYCYQKGLGVSQDKAKAALLYENSSSQGNKDAMAALSKLYLNGDGVPKDLSKALHWQEILAFDGDKDAQKVVLSNQSVQYQRADISNTEARSRALNSHIEQDYAWAEFCIKRAIELGNNDARLDYGLWLGKGDGLLKDYAKAEEYLTPFAENGNKDAAAVLGLIYQALNDKKKEMYWVEKAALKGDLNSQLTLAKAYENGEGVKKDYKMAVELYEKAAENGNVDAIKKVALAYGYGNGVKKDLEKAQIYHMMLDTQTAAKLAYDVFWGIGIKKNKKLGLLFFYQAGYKGDKESAENYKLWSK